MENSYAHSLFTTMGLAETLLGRLGKTHPGKLDPAEKSASEVGSSGTCPDRNSLSWKVHNDEDSQTSHPSW